MTYLLIGCRVGWLSVVAGMHYSEVSNAVNHNVYHDVEDDAGYHNSIPRQDKQTRNYLVIRYRVEYLVDFFRPFDRNTERVRACQSVKGESICQYGHSELHILRKHICTRVSYIFLILGGWKQIFYCVTWRCAFVDPGQELTEED